VILEGEAEEGVVDEEGEGAVPLVEVDVGLLADQVGVAAPDTLDLGQGVHDLLLAIDVGVEQTMRRSMSAFQVLMRFQVCDSSYRKMYWKLLFSPETSDMMGNWSRCCCRLFAVVVGRLDRVGAAEVDFPVTRAFCAMSKPRQGFGKECCFSLAVQNSITRCASVHGRDMQLITFILVYNATLLLIY